MGESPSALLKRGVFKVLFCFILVPARGEEEAKRVLLDKRALEGSETSTTNTRAGQICFVVVHGLRLDDTNIEYVRAYV
ncbi:hypothetical protein B0T25DRAFT_559365 [Lasiosphaeria hispida]|uniref:Uncharacterized protein n=1 Tax=Lasiosphaeria hispida TaxID=260671 RepID=A0AAJ0H6Z0_9PEZI|nr:hypothetical protein B0T25DRAFT_559365 [Lasiosphaeria hispida]